MEDVLAGLTYLRARHDVDLTRLAIVGQSFGGILATFSAERATRDQGRRRSAPAAQTWARAPELRERLISSARNARAPIFFCQAENEYDLAPTEQLSAALSRVQKSVVRKIYPAFGQGSEDGHSFGYFGANQWGDDVFEFLAKQLSAR